MCAKTEFGVETILRLSDHKQEPLTDDHGKLCRVFALRATVVSRQAAWATGVPSLFSKYTYRLLHFIWSSNVFCQSITRSIIQRGFLQFFGDSERHLFRDSLLTLRKETYFVQEVSHPQEYSLGRLVQKQVKIP
jgi:hypothetical protein